MASVKPEDDGIENEPDPFKRVETKPPADEDVLWQTRTFNNDWDFWDEPIRPKLDKDATREEVLKYMEEWRQKSIADSERIRKERIDRAKTTKFQLHSDEFKINLTVEHGFLDSRLRPAPGKGPPGGPPIEPA